MGPSLPYRTVLGLLQVMVAEAESEVTLRSEGMRMLSAAYYDEDFKFAKDSVVVDFRIRFASSFSSRCLHRQI